MNLAEIKNELGIEQFQLNTAEDANGVKTEWMRHWDNENRIAVSLHKDTITAIQADSATNLGLQTETRTGAQGEYIAKRIVMYKPAELVL
jgi:hypothetical protein